MTRPLQVAPSVLAGDFGRLAEEVAPSIAPVPTEFTSTLWMAVRAGNLFGTGSDQGNSTCDGQALNGSLMAVEPKRSIAVDA